MWRIKVAHLARVLGADMPIAEIDAQAVDRYTSARLGEGGTGGHPVARSTIAKELGVLAVTLTLAGRRGEYTRDLDKVMPQAWGSDYEPRERALTPDEMRRVMDDLRNDDLPMTRKPPGPPRKIGSKRSLAGPAPETTTYEKTRTRSMRDRAARVAFIVATSARWSASERALRGDIDWTTGLVLVRGTKTKKSWRYVPILPTTAPLLRIAEELGAGAGDAMFEPWINVNRDLRAVCRRLGIDPVTPNDLRRTTGRWLRDAGVEPHLVGAVLGHKDSRMVERVYGVLPPEALAKLLHERVGRVEALPAKRLPTGTTARRGPRKKGGGSHG